MDQELFLSKELILATLYRAQLDNSVGGGGSGGGYQQSHEGDDGGYANPSYGQATNRLFDDLHAEDGRGRKKRRKGRKRKRKSQHHPSDAGWAAAAEHYEEEDDATQNDDEEAYLDSEALKSHTRRYLEAEDGYLEDEEDEYEERSHRYQWENNQQDDGQSGDEENYGQSREIITFAERGETEISGFYYCPHPLLTRSSRLSLEDMAISMRRMRRPRLRQNRVEPLPTPPLQRKAYYSLYCCCCCSLLYRERCCRPAKSVVVVVVVVW